MTRTSPYIFDATPQTFNSLVLGNSIKGPVLVNYWAAKAAPCFMLMPRLIKLCADYQGKFLLVMLNTDQFGRFAKDQGVNSVPTVRVFYKEKTVDSVHGAHSDTEFRKIIDRYVVHDSDRLHLDAVTAYQHGEVQQAFALFEKAHADDPNNMRLITDHAKLLLREQRYTQASFLLASLPESERKLAEIICLRGFVNFNQIAQDAPNAEVLATTLAAHPEDNLARYRLSALKLLAGETEAALAYLLEIIRREPDFDSGNARQNMLAIFETIGHDDELVKRYRSLLSEALSATH
jgi:putative thioredoxin